MIAVCTSRRGHAFLAAALALTVVCLPGRAAEPPDAIAAEAKYLPDNCQLIAVVHVQQLLESEAYKALKKASARTFEQEDHIARTLPLPLERIKTLVMGGGVSAEEEGVFVIRLRKPISLADVTWSKDRVDPPLEVKVGDRALQRRRFDSYCLVAPDLLIIGHESVLRAVLKRDKAPILTQAMDSALKDADLTASAVFGFDVREIQAKHRGDPVPFISGLNMVRAEAATESLILSAKFDDTINFTVKARAVNDAAIKTLADEAKRFSEFHRQVLQNAPKEVVDIFNLKVDTKDKWVSTSKSVTPDVLAQLLRLVAK